MLTARLILTTPIIEDPIAKALKANNQISTVSAEKQIAELHDRLVHYVSEAMLRSLDVSSYMQVAYGRER